MNKQTLLLLITVILSFNLSAQKYLQGKVKVVNSFPDYKVKVVSSFPDLRVQKVTSSPTQCGQWQFVNSFEDFTIQFVDAFEDFSIQYVDAFPGRPNGNVESTTKNTSTNVSKSNNQSSTTAGNITGWENPVHEMYVKKINGRYFFATTRNKSRWFPTKARVQIVDTPADVRVKESYSSYSNFQIMISDTIPTKDLQWQFVDSDPDFTIEYTNDYNYYDISVMYWSDFLEKPSNLKITTRKEIFFAPQK